MGRRRRPLVWLVWGLVAAALLAWAWVVFDGWRHEQAWRFARQVLLEREFEDSPPVIIRWRDKAIGVRVATGTSDDAEMAARVVAEINDALEGTGHRLDLAHPEPAISLYLRNEGVAEDEAGNISVIWTPPGDAYFWSFTDDENVIREAVILVSETFTGEAKRALLLEELIQSLGPVNDSPLIPDSIFFESPDSVDNVPHLTRLDAKLLRFLYLHLEAGMDEAAVKHAFDAHWREVR